MLCDGCKLETTPRAGEAFMPEWYQEYVPNNKFKKIKDIQIIELEDLSHDDYYGKDADYDSEGNFMDYLQDGFAGSYDYDGNWWFTEEILDVIEKKYSIESMTQPEDFNTKEYHQWLDDRFNKLKSRIPQGVLSRLYGRGDENIGAQDAVRMMLHPEDDDDPNDMFLLNELSGITRQNKKTKQKYGRNKKRVVYRN